MINEFLWLLGQLMLDAVWSHGLCWAGRPVAWDRDLEKGKEKGVLGEGIRDLST